jgi:hypothetical protein
MQVNEQGQTAGLLPFPFLSAESDKEGTNAN